MVEIKDPCCGLCRTQFGCAIPQCEHHKRARILQKLDDNRQPGYRDPVGNEAVNNIMREQRRNRR